LAFLGIRVLKDAPTQKPEQAEEAFPTAKEDLVRDSGSRLFNVPGWLHFRALCFEA
jgi:hypothetical protein